MPYINNSVTLLYIQFDTWMERNVSIKEYRKVLKNIRGVVSGRKEVPMLKDRWKEIKTADHLECSAILSDYYTWFNCDILKAVMETVKGVTELSFIPVLSHMWMRYTDTPNGTSSSAQHLQDCQPQRALLTVY